MSEELAHHPLGASASERWINCPGSVLATKDLPDVDTEYSIEGTAAHSLSEMARQLGKPARDFIGYNIQVELVDGSYKVIEATKEMADHVQGWMDYISALAGDDYNEARVYVSEYIPGAFGTMDAAKATTRHVWILDLKYGQGVEVDAYENSQFMFYALGFYLQWGWLYDIDTFTLVVYQPRRNHIDEWTISVGKLLEWAENVLKPAAVQAMKPGAPFAAGKWCKFCKLRQTCTTRAKAIFEMNLDELDDLDDAVAKPLPQVATLTRDQIAKILARKGLVASFFKDLEHYAFGEIKEGRAVGDFKVVEGKSNRALAVSPVVFVERIKEHGLDPRLAYEEPELKSPAQLEKEYGKELFRPATKTKDAGPLADLFKKPTGKPVLVPGSDRRDPMDLSLATEMEDLDDAG